MFGTVGAPPHEPLQPEVPMDAPPDPPAPAVPRSALQPWTAVIVLTALTIPFALPLAFAGWLWTPAFAGGEPHPGEGTALRAASAGFLVVGFVAVPGPMRGDGWRSVRGSP